MAAEKENNKKSKKQENKFKVTGKKLKNKSEATVELEEIFKKGFKSAGLMVQGNEFVILFGTYTTEQSAKKNLAAIKTAGFTAQIEQ
ncbi:MAG: hypothetical protein K2K70_09350 [Lachnospiraceae bacterium]|nr:hypothetical protein [Lachnospiraceae bacterium]